MDQQETAIEFQDDELTAARNGADSTAYDAIQFTSDDALLSNLSIQNAAAADRLQAANDGFNFR